MLWLLLWLLPLGGASRMVVQDGAHTDGRGLVQTEAPVNLICELADAGGDETGHRTRLSWSYPVPSDLQYGWITLEYELQYRREAEAGGWKVKHPLREPWVELLGLPAGDYLVRVRCRSHNYGLWSRWSSALQMSLLAGPPAGNVLVPVVVAGVAVVALLAVLLGVMPQGRRIKDYFLPPIPKPRIIGIDPMLLKGNLAELDHHFSNFHSFSPPSSSSEVWDRVSAGNVFLSACGVSSDPTAPRDAPMFPRDPAGVSADPPASYVRSAAPYCCLPPPAFAAAPDRSARSGPEVVCLPGTEYSVTGLTGLPGAGRSPQDFYTCVQLLKSGEVHLVPCPPPAYCREFPPPPRVEEEEEEEKKKKMKMADGQDK